MDGSSIALLTFLVAGSFLSPVTLAISETEALLKFKTSLKGDDILSTWSNGTNACEQGKKWRGVVCLGGLVAELRLDSMGLSGQIDVEALVQLPGLRRVSFMNNSFTGPIPKLNRVKNLRSIFLSRNGFSGEIPEQYFIGMVSLRKIRVSDNRFEGEIPSSVAEIPNLVELELQNNQFVGAIPDLETRNLMSFNVSNNRLVGTVPESLYRFNSSSFSGNSDLCGYSLENPCNERAATVTGLVGELLMLMGVILLVLVLVALVAIRMRGEKQGGFEFAEKDGNDKASPAMDMERASCLERMSSDGSYRRGYGSGRMNSSGKMSELVVVNEERGVFGMADLMKAGAEGLSGGSDGGFGSSYKAVMANGVAVVVKRMRNCNRVGREGFEMDMRRLGRVKHPNLLTPLAYHYRRDEKLLISEFVPNGSLLYLLHGDQQVPGELNWGIRLKLVKGIARGLSYLHSLFPAAALPHGNLKSSNVLITSNFESLLSEYGLDPVVNIAQVGKLLFAYIAPEAVQHGIVSPKCDVFCLGIVILEILTGKFPSQYVNNTRGGVDVLELVGGAISQGRALDVLDQDLVLNATANSRLEMEKLLQIGADCAERNPDLRLTLEEAVKQIGQIKYGGSEEYRLPSSRKMSMLSPLTEIYSKSPSSFESMPLSSQSPSYSFSSQSQSPGCDNNSKLLRGARLDSPGGQPGSHSGHSSWKMRLNLHDELQLSGRLRLDSYGNIPSPGSRLSGKMRTASYGSLASLSS